MIRSPSTPPASIHTSDGSGTGSPSRSSDSSGKACGSGFVRSAIVVSSFARLITAGSPFAPSMGGQEDHDVELVSSHESTIRFASLDSGHRRDERAQPAAHGDPIRQAPGRPSPPSPRSRRMKRRHSIRRRRAREGSPSCQRPRVSRVRRASPRIPARPLRSLRSRPNHRLLVRGAWISLRISTTSQPELS